MSDTTEKKPDTTATGSGSRLLLTGVVVLMFVALLAVGAVVVKRVLDEPRSAAAGEPDPDALENVLTDARRLMDQQEHDQAAVTLEKALEHFGGSQSVWLALGEAYLGMANYAGAYDAHLKAIEIGPRHAQLQFDAGTLANKVGRVEEAERHYLLAQEEDVSDPRFPLYLAMVRIKLNKTEAATADLVRAVNLEPDLAEAWGTLAELEFLENDLALASQHVAEAQRVQPAVTRWRLLEAKILKRQNKPEEAATVLLSLDESERLDADIAEVIAECYGMLGEPAKVAETYDAAARATATDAALWYKAAVWWEKAGVVEKGEECASNAVLLGYADANDLLERLRQ